MTELDPAYVSAGLGLFCLLIVGGAALFLSGRLSSREERDRQLLNELEGLLVKERERERVQLAIAEAERAEGDDRRLRQMQDMGLPVLQLEEARENLAARRRAANDIAGPIG